MKKLALLLFVLPLAFACGGTGGEGGSGEDDGVQAAACRDLCETVAVCFNATEDETDDCSASCEGVVADLELNLGATCVGMVVDLLSCGTDLQCGDLNENFFYDFSGCATEVDDLVDLCGDLDDEFVCVDDTRVPEGPTCALDCSCDELPPPPDTFECDGDTVPVSFPISRRCDGIIDCVDLTDEMGCPNP